MSQLIDMRSARFAEDKYRYIEELRSQAAIGRVEGGHVFFSQEDARYVMRCEDFRFDFFHGDPSISPYLANSVQHELLNMHGAGHERLKKLVIQALRDHTVAGLKDRIRDILNDLISRMPDQGEIDFCSGLAHVLPSRVLGPMFGVPYEEAEGLNDWIRAGGRKVEALQSGIGVAEVEEANRQIHSYLRALLDERRKAPGTDIFSQLILAEADGERLKPEELIFLAGEMASAGVDTTRAQLPLILEQLLLHPEQLEMLRRNPSLIMSAVDEGMRFSPLPWAIPHRAVRDVEYKGVQIKSGDRALVLIPAVNRDPEAVSEPHTFDITRGRQRHFSFGYGMHACPGAFLARMEMALALEAILEAFAEIHLVGISERDGIQKGQSPLDMRLNVTRRDK
ncbi:MAG: cytochrome P450 [Leisingera sp.]